MEEKVVEELRFEKIYLQSRVVRKLQASFQKQKISQTYIFCGKPSSGKTKVALTYAALLLCESPQKIKIIPKNSNLDSNEKILLDYYIEPCNECKSCLLVKYKSHPDVIFIRPLGQEIRVEQIRELKENAYVHPYLGKWKIFIIEQADKLNEFSSNSMLKILEETPERVIFILIAENEFNILPTIISRAEVINFITPTHKASRLALIEILPKSEKYINFVYSLSEGKFGKTIEIANNIGISEEFVDNFSPAKLKEAHRQFLESFDEVFEYIFQSMNRLTNIEDQICILENVNFYKNFNYILARKNFIRGLLLAKALPSSFAMLYSSLFIEKVQEFEQNLVNIMHKNITRSKQTLNPEMIKDLDRQISYSIKNVCMKIYYEFLEVFQNFLRDCYSLYYLGFDSDEILNVNFKNDIITLVQVRGVSFVVELNDVIIKSHSALRHNVQPLLVFENLFTEIGGRL